MGSDPDKLFPYEMMQEHLSKLAKYGIITAHMTQELRSGENVDSPADDTTSGKDSYSSSHSFSRSYEQLKKRIRDVVVDMERLGYIWNYYRSKWINYRATL